MQQTIQQLSYKIMYVAVAAKPKPFKVDNINGIPSRRWNGVGDVVTVLHKAEAEKLLQHTMMFQDVTGWSEEKISARVAELQEAQRSARRAEHSAAVKQALNDASIEDLESRLRELRGSAGRVQPTTDPKDLPKVEHEVPTKRPFVPKTDGTGRPNNTTDLTAEIAEAITKLDATRDFNKDGTPIKEHVQEILGYPITHDELSVTFQAMTG